ncbi:ovarian-specific serine/threonine-protein kinase Lok-like [Aphidius gifuensis]|uniref:ovarian-specific serine/threonine-protein kinase Lok-like n=1 Tax=Aphidius gifuensis TaxID=684658 RepID=UPI001CDBC642|nr:ovarian-specific serine/threonine-protein kinase Lok-like [Aphidius gifuensis]
MDIRLTGLNFNNNDDEDRLPDTLPGDETQSQPLSSSPLNKISKGTWGILIPCCQRQLDEHHNNNRKPLKICCLTKNEYKAGRLEHVDIQFNKDNTDSKRLLQTSKTQFIIKRERVTNYETADYEGDFVAVIHDKSTNGTFINNSKLKNKKGILHHNDTISIAKSGYEVFQYVQTKNLVEIPSELAKNYVALRLLGHGICGPVKLIYSKTDYCPLALKCIKKNSFYKMAHQNSFMSEADILKGLKHPNVIQMVHAINTPSNIFIMLEYMQGGELHDRIKKNVGLSEKLTKFYFYQIATAVEYLHGKGITHRDLKPENILLLDNDEYTLVKVTDLAFSKLVDHKIMIKKFNGTSYYVAPEIFRSIEKGQYTSRFDVWSLGVMFQRRYKSVNPKDRYSAPHVLASSWLDDKELMITVSKTLKPYIISEIKSLSFDRGIGSK